MNCTEAQARLSDYLEKSLNADDFASVESHLLSCSSCRAELAGLAVCIRQIGALSQIEPPIGFTQRVMAHIREDENKPGLGERLLFPLRIKIPIHATAAVLIGILAVYLLQKEELRDQASSPPQQTFTAKDKEQPVATKGPANQPADADKKERKASSKTPAEVASVNLERQEDATDRLREFRDRAKPPSINPPDLRQNRISEENPQKTGLPSSVVIAPSPPPVKGLSVSDETSQPGRFTFSEGFIRPPPLAISPEPKPIPEAAPMRLSPELTAQIVDVELVVRRHSAQPGAGRRESSRFLQESAETPRTGEEARRNLDRQLVGRLMANLPQSSGPQTVWLTIPASQYEGLRKDLEGIGTIESETPSQRQERDTFFKTATELRVKLTILPPAETKRTSPSKLPER